MTAPDPADVELVADAIARRHCWDGIAEVDAVAPANAESFRHDAEAVVAALGARLVSPDADTRTERMTIFGGATSQRTVRKLTDGSTLVGPWVPVATPKES